MASIRGRVHMLIIQSFLLMVAVTLASAQEPRPATCSDRCGDVEIPYPFGIEPRCYLELPGQEEQQFKVTCDRATTPPLLKFLNGDILNQSITNISVGVNEMQVMLPISINCYTNNSYDESLYRHSQLILPSGYTISDKNTVYIIGCNKITLYQGFVSQVDPEPKEIEKLGTSGVSLCQDLLGKLPQNCSGIGCTKGSIVSGLHNITLDVWTIGTGLGSTSQWGLDYPCSYGFIVDERNFTFAGNATFRELNSTTRPELPVVVNWEIGKDNCELAAYNNQISYACKAAYAECVNGSSGGYFCRCQKGYQGNPYVPHGCEDVDECTNSTICHPPSKCRNLKGNYSCICPEGQTYDDNNNKPCVKIVGKPKNTSLQISLGVSTSFLVLVVLISWIYWEMNKRRLIKLKKKYFKENGGLTLQQQLASHGGAVETAKIFTAEELEKATNNYHADEILGEGAYGTVYKGILPDKKVVAIKKSKIGAPTQSEQFVNEVIVLSQINHRNVVKLLGCCFETEVPLLVYEYITHGTLFEHIFNKGKGYPLSWELRLKIASETAGALAYLHSSTSTPIIHRDVKATNILLDDNYTAKVSDFGASRFIPLDQTELATLVQGTLGYLDPEYFHSNQLTEKSDVYSFGVVLAELLTSRVALSFARPVAERCLASFFVSSIEKDCLIEILDADIVNEGNIGTAEQVAYLAKRCLGIRGEERPSMKEVAMELEGRQNTAKHPWRNNANICPEETEYLLGSPINSEAYIVNVKGDGDEGSSGTTSGYDSMQIQMLMPYDDAR